MIRYELEGHFQAIYRNHKCTGVQTRQFPQPSLIILRSGLNKLRNLFPIQRTLYKKPLDPMLTGSLPILGQIIAGDHRNQNTREIVFQVLGKLKAIHSRQTHIRKHEIRRGSVDFLQGLFAASDLRND